MTDLTLGSSAVAESCKVKMLVTETRGAWFFTTESRLRLTLKLILVAVIAVGVSVVLPTADEPAGAGVPAARGDGTGAFRVMCGFSHALRDDPIVHPGKPGKSHQHLFFGNESANASSTASSLASSGSSTCHGGERNRSAYWVPAMYRSNGTAVVPDQTHVYYKSGTVDPGSIQMFPAGLRIIAGNARTRFDQSDAVVRWLCTPDSSESAHRSASATMPQCPSGQFLQASVIFPQCWDGRRLTSRNQSHMAYPVRGSCPSSHPTPVPRINLNFLWKIGGDGNAGWKLASDRAGAPGGRSLHADWFDGWDRDTMSIWVDSCVRARRNCRLGELGNGDRLERHRLGSGAFSTALPGYGGSSVAGMNPHAAPVGRMAYPHIGRGGIYPRGFAIDPNDTGPVTVSISVDGSTRWSGPANVYRDHLANKFARYGSNHGFKPFISVGSGSHQVCATATAKSGVSRDLGCHSFSL